jgi:hypothetical protein
VQAQSPPSSFVVTVAREPAHQTTLADVVIGSLGVAGALLLLAIVLGGAMSLLLVAWNRRHPPERRHLPSVSPLSSSPAAPPSSPAQ